MVAPVASHFSWDFIYMYDVEQMIFIGFLNHQKELFCILLLRKVMCAEFLGSRQIGKRCCSLAMHKNSCQCGGCRGSLDCRHDVESYFLLLVFITMDMEIRQTLHPLCQCSRNDMKHNNSV